ncbi:unnamed protein product [Miscanthus lutarioriparius]|uniref:LRAT domain-containing protein n=1 Tax=Miscanthus lutarioriparius TaxID=422564 RepID=A0A811QRK2_9POAL|nr:unnamed protein product [Miscanthus lutarioriparius]
MDRVTVESSRIERWQLRPGDHIYVWRKISDHTRIYSHHGIYESDEKVIHLSSIPGGGSCPRCRGAERRDDVVVCCLDCFLRGGELCLFAYAVPKWFYDERNTPKKGDVLAPLRQLTCSMDAEDPPETVLGRAKDLLTKGRVYLLVHNNCFHFAFYCKTGRQYFGPVALVVDTSAAAIMPSDDGPHLDRRNGTARVVPPPPAPARRRRSREWSLPQPSFRTIAAVGAGLALVAVLPELAPVVPELAPVLAPFAIL